MAFHFRPTRIHPIAERIERSVLCGAYTVGEQLPPVRQLATEIAVNPNTVQHAYAELERNGIVVPNGTLGRFVTDDPAVIEACRTRIATQLIHRFTGDIRQLSIPVDQAIAMIKEVSA